MLFIGTSIHHHQLTHPDISAYPSYRRRIQSASHCHHGFHRELFQPGWRSRACARNCDCCGIIVITLQWTTVGSYGGGGAHRVLCYSYWCLDPVGRTFSCHTMLRCLEAIWVVIKHWPDWPIASIGPGCLMMPKNGSASVSCASRESRQLDDIIRWEIFRTVIAGIVLPWIFWTSVIRYRTAIATF